MRVVKIGAFTDGLECGRCGFPLTKGDPIAMLIATLSECEHTTIWCVVCADEVAMATGDIDWEKDKVLACSGCSFVRPIEDAKKDGWTIDPEGIGTFCPFCSHEFEHTKFASLPLSCSTIPQEKGSFKQGGIKTILWIAMGLQMVLIWDIGIDWLGLIPLSALGFLGARLRKLCVREPGFPPPTEKRQETW